MLVHSHPPRSDCFCKGWTNELSRNIMGTTNTASSWSLRMAWTSAVITGMWFFISLGRMQFLGLPLDFLYFIALTPPFKEGVWEPASSKVCALPSYPFRDLKMTTMWVRGPSGPPVNWTWSRTPLAARPLCASSLKRGHEDVLGPQVSMPTQTLCLIVFGKFGYSLFPRVQLSV